jgi:hypothetical protein
LALVFEELATDAILLICFVTMSRYVLCVTLEHHLQTLSSNKLNLAAAAVAVAVAVAAAAAAAASSAAAAAAAAAAGGAICLVAGRCCYLATQTQPGRVWGITGLSEVVAGC